jgi:hypothetical protein
MLLSIVDILSSNVVVVSTLMVITLLFYVTVNSTLVPPSKFIVLKSGSANIVVPLL